MKIAALNPHFLIETPPSVDEAEREKITRELRLVRLGQAEATEGPEAESEQNQGERRTKEGLQRLAKLIQEKKKRAASVSRGDPRDPVELERRRVISLYDQVSRIREAFSAKGSILDREF